MSVYTSGGTAFEVARTNSISACMYDKTYFFSNTFSIRDIKKRPTGGALFANVTILCPLYSCLSSNKTYLMIYYLIYEPIIGE